MPTFRGAGDQGAVRVTSIRGVIVRCRALTATTYRMRGKTTHVGVWGPRQLFLRFQLAFAGVSGLRTWMAHVEWGWMRRRAVS